MFLETLQIQLSVFFNCHPPPSSSLSPKDRAKHSYLIFLLRLACLGLFFPPCIRPSFTSQPPPPTPNYPKGSLPS